MSEDIKPISSFFPEAQIEDSKTDKTAISIDLRSVKAEFAPGVCEPSSIYGFTDEQIYQTAE